MTATPLPSLPTLSSKDSATTLEEESPFSTGFFPAGAQRNRPSSLDIHAAFALDHPTQTQSHHPSRPPHRLSDRADSAASIVIHTDLVDQDSYPASCSTDRDDLGQGLHAELKPPSPSSPAAATSPSTALPLSMFSVFVVPPSQPAIEAAGAGPISATQPTHADKSPTPWNSPSSPFQLAEMRAVDFRGAADTPRAPIDARLIASASTDDIRIRSGDERNGAEEVDKVVGTEANGDAEEDDSSDPPIDSNARCVCCNRGPLRHLFSRKRLREVVDIFKLVWPVALSGLLQMGLNFVTSIFVGHLGKEELDATVLSLLLNNVTGLSMIIGLATAMETLCSQSFGANNKKRVGDILQRAIIIETICCLPVAAIWLNAEHLMLAAQQDPFVARLSGSFLRRLLPKLPLDMLWIVLNRYLQSQSILTPTNYAALAGNLVNVLFLYLFIYQLGFGVFGAAYALSLAALTMDLVLLGFIIKKRLWVDTWRGWTVASLMEWGQFIRLAVPGLFMICLEWWCFELASLLAGTLGTAQLAAQAVVLQIGSLTFQIPLGISIACNIRVGNLLGGNKPRLARRSAHSALILTASVAVVSALLVLALKDVVGRIYTDDVEVITLVAAVVPIVSCFQMFDFTQAVLSGILRGCGRQKLGALLNFVGFWIFGMPLCVVLTFVLDLDLHGLWTGLAIGLFVQCSLMMFFVLRTNWPREAQLAQERSVDQGGSGGSLEGKGASKSARVEDGAEDGAVDDADEADDVDDADDDAAVRFGAHGRRAPALEFELSDKVGLVGNEYLEGDSDSENDDDDDDDGDDDDVTRVDSRTALGRSAVATTETKQHSRQARDEDGGSSSAEEEASSEGRFKATKQIGTKKGKPHRSRSFATLTRSAAAVFRSTRSLKVSRRVKITRLAAVFVSVALLVGGIVSAVYLDAQAKPVYRTSHAESTLTFTATATATATSAIASVQSTFVASTAATTWTTSAAVATATATATATAS